jgi:hypothetical protein
MCEINLSIDIYITVCVCVYLTYSSNDMDQIDIETNDTNVHVSNDWHCWTILCCQVKRVDSPTYQHRHIYILTEVMAVYVWIDMSISINTVRTGDVIHIYIYISGSIDPSYLVYPVHRWH